MAHAAAQVPSVVGTTSQSLGRSVSLWVSAFEILTHPGRGDSGYKEVYRVFDNVSWKTERCRERIHSCYEGRNSRSNIPKRTLACWMYGELFRARNDYLHGNEVADDRLVVKASGQSLFMFPQPLYRLLLTGFLGLDDYGPHLQKGAPIPFDRSHFWSIERQGESERALAKILDPRKRG
jgi:hypothetical protein